MEYQSGAVRPIESISNGWNLIKDNYWVFFGMTTITFILLIILAIILGAINQVITTVVAGIMGVATQNTGEVGAVSAAIAPQIISMVISLFTNIIVITLSGALFSGIYKAMSKVSMGGAADFGELFSGFQKIVPCLIVAVVMSIIQFVIGLVMLGVGVAIGVSAVGAALLTPDGQINPAVFGGLLLAIIAFVAIYIVISLITSALTAFVYPLIGERDVSGGQALLLSVKSGLSNIIGIIALLILLGLMAFGGALVCFVGIFFVAPILSASLFSAYQSVFGKPQDLRQHTPPPPPNFGNQPSY